MIDTSEPQGHGYIDQDDLHTITAAKMFGISPDKVTPEQRRLAKAVNFPAMYQNQSKRST